VIELFASSNERIEFVGNEVTKFNFKAFFFEELHCGDAKIIGDRFMTRIVKNEKRTFFVFSVREAARLPIRLAILNRNDRSRRYGIDIVGKPVAALGSKRFRAFEHGSVLSFLSRGNNGSRGNCISSKSCGHTKSCCNQNSNQFERR